MPYYRKTEMPAPQHALPGRATPMALTNHHYVLHRPLQPPFPQAMCSIVLGMGCFWGAEKRFWQRPGVFTTAVGYSGGYTPNPSYQEVCSGLTGHNEVVLVVFDPIHISLETLLHLFWESHDPTQGMRQGNDVGTQYRSGIYYADSQQYQVAQTARTRYQAALHEAGRGDITTEIVPLGDFYYAEEYHQQYLAKNPNGYCGLGGTGVIMPPKPL